MTVSELPIFPATRRKAVAFPAILFLILCLGALPRLLSYDFGLPYIEYADEVHLYWTGQSVRGQYDPTYNAGYPPAFLIMEVGAQLINEAAGNTGLAPTIQLLRLMGVFANLATIALVGLSARLLAGDIAGLFAALFWAVAPLPVEYSLYAIAETFAYPLAALVIYLAFRALFTGERWYWSLPVAVLLSLFEYRYVIFLLPSGLLLLRNLARRLQTRGRLILGVSVLALVVVSLAGAYLFVPGRRDWLVRILTVDLWNFPSLFAHIYAAIAPLNALVVLVVGALGLWAWRRAGITPAQHWALVISLLMILAVCWSSSAVVWEGDRDVRTKHIIPALSLAVILFAALFAHSLNLFKDARLRLALGIAIPLIVLTPQVAQTVEFVQYSRQENSNVVVRQWADENLPPGRVLVNRFNMNTFNPDWGGIPHRHWFDWWITEDFTGVSPAEWRARGMTYMLLPYHERENLLQTAEGRAYLDQMLLLRDFPASPSRHGPVTAMYRLWRMDVERAVSFADGITLLGYDVLSEDTQPGGAIQLRFYWHAGSAPRDNYSLFVHLSPLESSQPIAQYDGNPAAPERLTLTWIDPTETLLSPPITLDIPADAAPGTYRVVAGLYNFTTLNRLPIVDENGGFDQVELMQVMITP